MSAWVLVGSLLLGAAADGGAHPPVQLAQAGTPNPLPPPINPPGSDDPIPSGVTAPSFGGIGSFDRLEKADRADRKSFEPCFGQPIWSSGCDTERTRSCDATSKEALDSRPACNGPRPR